MKIFLALLMLASLGFALVGCGESVSKPEYQEQKGMVVPGAKGRSDGQGPNKVEVPEH